MFLIQNSVAAMHCGLLFLSKLHKMASPSLCVTVPPPYCMTAEILMQRQENTNYKTAAWLQGAARSVSHFDSLQGQYSGTPCYSLAASSQVGINI